MTARFVGAAVIGAVSLYTGGAYTVLCQRRAQLLSSFCRLVGALEDGISVMGLPMDRILSTFEDPGLSQAGFLSAVRTVLEQDPYADALRQALVQSDVRRFMEDEEYGLLWDFFGELGSDDRVREGERCAYVHARLQTLRDEAGSALPARCRIARTLAGAIGCAAALMLL